MREPESEEDLLERVRRTVRQVLRRAEDGPEPEPEATRPLEPSEVLAAVACGLRFFQELLGTLRDQLGEAEADPGAGGDLAGKVGHWIERLAAVAGEIEACLPPEPGAMGLEEDEG